MTSKQIQELIECGLLNYDDRLPKLAQTALDALQRVEEVETELVKQTIGESIEDIREARIETRRKYPHLFNV